MPIVQTRAGQVETVEHGDGEQLFVMVHAAGAGPHAYDRLVQLLASKQRRFVAGARVGYGNTEIESGGDLIARNVAATDALMADIGVQDIVMFGHSMGGLISLLSAAGRLSAGAGNLKALVLYDPILVTLLRPHIEKEREALEWDRAIIEKLRAEVAAGRPESGVQAFIEAWNGQPWQKLPDSVRQQFIGLAETLVAETAATSYYPLEDGMLRQIDLPTLILVGERSPALIHLTAARAAELIPAAKVEMIAGADHMGPVNKPASITPAIERFLEQL
ncbi:MAG: alpha/beta hydrolase [Pseudomonadota bacterium]